MGRLLATSLESHLSALCSSVVRIIGGAYFSKTKIPECDLVITTMLRTSDSVVAEWSILDMVMEDGSLQRFSTSRAATHLWRLSKLDKNETGISHLPSSIVAPVLLPHEAYARM